MEKFLVAGLGNPGKKYEKTRHNLGFRVIDALNNLGLSQKMILFKPQKFMNLSGPEVLKKLNYYRLKTKDLIVICDDIDLPFGEVRIRQKGSSAGHKGIQSIIDELATSEFKRVRLGIGRPREGVDAEEYVLQEFSADEKATVEKMIDKAVEKIIKLI